MQKEEFLYILSKAESPIDVVMAWGIYKSIDDNSKAIISLENYEKDALPKNFTKTVFYENNDFSPYFQSENLFYIDNEILKNMITSTNDTMIPIDYSVMFDTNYASYIHQFVNNDMYDLNNEVFASIALLLREEFQYDYNFYLVENSKGIDLNNDFDIEYFKKKYFKVYRNIVSLELFKSINSDIFKKEGKVQYTISTVEAEQNAEIIIENLFCDEKGKQFFNEMSFLQKLMTLLLIGVFRINFSSKRNAQKKIIELFDFMNEQVGIYFEREAIVAYKYFKEQGKFRIFSKIQKNADTTNLLETINNISWDFIAPRFMEYFMKVGGEGKFFIPFFLSHDAGLREVIKLFKIKGVFFEGFESFIPLPSINTQEYYDSENCKIDFDFYFSSESKSKRAIRVNENRKEIDKIINQEYNKLLTQISNSK